MRGSSRIAALSTAGAQTDDPRHLMRPHGSSPDRRRSLLSSCATNPPPHSAPQPHTMPSRPRPTPEAVAAGITTRGAADRFRCRRRRGLAGRRQHDVSRSNSTTGRNTSVLARDGSPRAPVGLPDAPRALVKTPSSSRRDRHRVRPPSRRPHPHRRLRPGDLHGLRRGRGLLSRGRRPREDPREDRG